jgi:hypothetical protein
LPGRNGLYKILATTLAGTPFRRLGRKPMKLEFSLEEVRVLDAAVEYIKKHKDVAVKIYAGYEDDIKTVNAVGGMLRAAYLHEKQKS